ncbi:hypothetical protein INT48_009022 [Thamnidium elegans]|uniref:Uncharacterized protein n=1 Tax=Thamnidium elegans TaxID=101142 RepID=A0A8H7SXC5_9FUNG|nr:hypothetical protein INT48_009022 [Thamnidium elegans]
MGRPALTSAEREKRERLRLAKRKRPPLSEEEQRERKKYLEENSDVIKNMQNTLSFDDFLMLFDASYEDYITAIRASLSCAKVFLKRNCNELFINNYNSMTLNMHQANMDIQYILYPYACCMYIVDYINKSDKEMSKVLEKVLSESVDKPGPIKNVLRSLTSKYYNLCEVSSQEASYNLLQLRMSETSRATVFVPTGKEESRCRMLKSKFDLQKLNPNSEDIYIPGLIEHYQNTGFPTSFSKNEPMNIDTLMNEMSVQEEDEVVTEEVYVSLYQKRCEPTEVDICTAMECDEELADELGLDLKEEKTLEEVNARVKEYFDAHLNQPELKLESGGKKTYRKYTNEQIDLFIDLISAGSDVKSACSSTGISLWSGYKYRKTFREDPENGLIRRKKRGRKGSLFKLQQRHAEWIIKYIDENTTAVLEQIKLDLSTSGESSTNAEAEVVYNWKYVNHDLFNLESLVDENG